MTGQQLQTPLPYGTDTPGHAQINPEGKGFRLWLTIFFVFFKISPVTFGGGYAMIPILERELVERKRWMTMEDISDVFAVAGSAPGPIAVNAGIFIGFRLAGLPGAAAGLLGAITPTFLITLALAVLFTGFKSNPLVQSAFLGIRPTVVALILYAGIKMAKTAFFLQGSRYDRGFLLLVFIVTMALLFMNVNPIATIFVGAAMGMLYGAKLRGLLEKASGSDRDA